MSSFVNLDLFVVMSAGRTVGKALLLFATLLIAKHVRNYRRSRNLPPSPFQLPFVGCLPFLDELAHLTLSKWANKLGKIFSCRFGGKIVIVLNDADMIKEAFGMEALSGRPSMYTAEVTSKGYGIMFSEQWALHRKFAARTFRSLGLGKHVMEERIEEESSRLIQSIRELNGQPFENKRMLRGTVGNIICSVLFGETFDVLSENTHEFYERMNLVSKFFGVAGALNIFPILRFVPSIKRAFQKVIEALDCGASFIRNSIKEHEENRDATGVINDFTEAFINARNEEMTRLGRTVNFSDQQLVGAARELFMTGYDTVTTTLRWAFLYMIQYPEIQSKVQAEIDNLTNGSRHVTFADLRDLPYTQAVLFESARMSTIAPLGVPHCAIEDTEFRGFTIPKGAWVVANLWHVHHDDKVWGDADVFRPERFLSADRKVVLAPKEFMPFSVGKRSCPGEALANMEVPLVFLRILQNFSLLSDQSCDLTPVNGIALDTRSYQMRAVPRTGF